MQIVEPNGERHLNRSCEVVVRLVLESQTGYRANAPTVSAVVLGFIVNVMLLCDLRRWRSEGLCLK